MKKKNRFYYSAVQAANRPRHFTYVWNGTKWVCYSEWCSTPEHDCCFEDAKLVYETDDEHPQIKIESYEDDKEDLL